MRIIYFVVVALLAFPDFLCAIEPEKIKIGVSVPLSGSLA
jgi:hypothetical protein